MLRKLFALSSLVLLWAGVHHALVPADAHAQGRGRGRGGQTQMRFAAMDTNRDGAISQEEWRGSPQAFQNHDWNGDGQLSGQEVAVGAQRNSNWEEADHMPNRYERFVSWTQAGFTTLDHDRDRRISRKEWHHDVETFRRVDRNRDGFLDQTEFLGEDWDDAREDNFDDLDMNNNGRVERNEWLGGAEAFNDLDRNRDGVLSRFEVLGGQETTGDTWDQFASLDYDGNGTIARNEWHWSLGSFDKRDLNRDNVLSRREFDVTGGANTAAPVAASQTVRVNGQRGWNDAGIDVRAGDTLALNATGTIQMSDDAQDIATPAGSRTGRRAPDAPILNQPAGALLARIGNYGPIFVGDRRSITAPVSGRLYFGMNDDHLADNRGEFTVVVTNQGSTVR